MFLLFAISAIALAISSAHYLDLGSITIARTYAAEAVCLAGMGAFSNGSMRHKSALIVFFIWAAYSLLIDFVFTLPPWAASIEIAIFTVLAGWVYFRPYKYLSSAPNTKNVCIAFYGGPNAPVLSIIADQLGFPFSSVAISCGTTAVRPSKVRGIMVETSTSVLYDKGYVFVDTGVPWDTKIHGTLMGLIGTKTGWGIFRFRCLHNLKPVLECLGYEWVPKIPFSPSLFFGQCLRNLS